MILRVDQNAIQSESVVLNNLEQKAKHGLIGRHVAWIKEKRSAPAAFGVKLLVTIEIICASLSIVGLIPLVKALDVSSKLNAYAVKKVELGASAPCKPPGKEPILVKSFTRTFNHVDDFAIEGGKLWYRKRGDSDAVWSLFYFDKIGNAEPKEIKADGANLMVRDANNVIHYKKVLTERRDWRGRYHYKDKTASDNWYDRWFAFPLIQNIYHLFQTKRITLPEGIISWAVSHRGTYNRYFEDASGIRHYEFPMVTTLYALPKAGDHILYADPYLTGGFSHRVEGPRKDFQGLKMDASASMLFLYGKIKGTGEEKMYVRLADFDTLGRNPFLPGFWTKRLRGSEKWEEVLPPPLSGLATLNRSTITILQDGTGNAARELRIEGTFTDGQRGCYLKHINETSWRFLPAQ